jgi:hypothetical protein
VTDGRRSYPARIRQSLGQDVFRVRPLHIALPGLFAASILVFALLQPWLTMPQATRDATLVASTLTDPFLIPIAGFVSSIGIAVWVGAGAISIFAALMVRATQGWSLPVILLLALGLQSAVFAFDDLFMIHDRVAPLNGIRERYVYAVLAAGFFAASALYALRMRFADASLLVLASAFFFVSTVYDKFGHTGVETIDYLVEDGAKLFGIAYWFAFCCRCAWSELDGARHPAMPSSASS